MSILPFIEIIKVKGCLLAFILLAACHSPANSQIINWNEVDVLPAFEALQTACKKVKKPYCTEVNTGFSELQKRQFFQNYFQPKLLSDEALLTAYYLPLIEATYQQSSDYPYPVWGVPKDFVTPYLTRQQIDQGALNATETPILWVKNKVDLFFLHIQGSGRAILPDGEMVSINFAKKNGQPYESIGKLLIAEGEISKEEMSLQSLKRWLHAHPEQIDRVFWTNPSYIFFSLKKHASAVGGQGVELTAKGSLAVDPNVIAYGTPVLIQTRLPNAPENSITLLTIAQDTGSAIKTKNRADWFLGFGPQVEALAGEMKQPATFMVLEPRS